MGGLAGWISGAGARRGPEPEALGAMLGALAHRCTGQDTRALIEQRPGYRIVLGNTVHDTRAGISLALDGSIDNRDELRRALSVRSYVFKGSGDDELVLRAYQHWD